MRETKLNRKGAGDEAMPHPFRLVFIGISLILEVGLAVKSCLRPIPNWPRSLPDEQRQIRQI